MSVVGGFFFCLWGLVWLASFSFYDPLWLTLFMSGSGTMVWEAVSEEYTGEWVDGVQVRLEMFDRMCSY
jgi:hypothetical protein